jgi:hypothetical protein
LGGLNVLFYTHTTAQNKKPAGATTPPPEKVYQLSGLVLDKVTGQPIPFTRITTISRKRYAVCNEEGFFSIPTVANDTLVFQSIGYKPATFIFAQYLQDYKGDTTQPYIYEIQYMLSDTITLPTVVIYPYKSAEDIRQAVLNNNEPTQLSIADAQMNVSPQVVSYFLNELPTNDAERLAVMRRRYNELYLRTNERPNVGFDAVAVFNLISYLNKKSKKEKSSSMDD